MVLLEADQIIAKETPPLGGEVLESVLVSLHAGRTSVRVKITD